MSRNAFGRERRRKRISFRFESEFGCLLELSVWKQVPDPIGQVAQG